MKLSSNSLLYQGLPCCPTRFCKKRIGLGSTFDRAGLDSVRAVRIDHQWGQGVSRTSGTEPSQGIDEADATEGHALTLRRGQHDHADQVVDQGKDGQLLQDPDETLTVQHIQAHCLLEVP